MRVFSAQFISSLLSASSLLFSGVLASTQLSLVCVAQDSAAKTQAPSRLTQAKTPAVPEVIYFDGVIYTGVGLAGDKPQTVEAMAIGGGKVIAVGKN
jgi:hypothetical protein